MNAIYAILIAVGCVFGVACMMVAAFFGTLFVRSFIREFRFRREIAHNHEKLRAYCDMVTALRRENRLAELSIMPAYDEPGED